jgi:hypothetical protein
MRRVPLLINVLRSKKARSNGLFLFGTPYRIRTGVTAVRGRRPEPLDEGSVDVFLAVPAVRGAYYTAPGSMLKPNSGERPVTYQVLE